jgi:hypothetical protein
MPRRSYLWQIAQGAAATGPGDVAVLAPPRLLFRPPFLSGEAVIDVEEGMSTAVTKPSPPAMPGGPGRSSGSRSVQDAVTPVAPNGHEEATESAAVTPAASPLSQTFVTPVVRPAPPVAPAAGRFATSATSGTSPTSETSATSMTSQGGIRVAEAVTAAPPATSPSPPAIPGVPGRLLELRSVQDTVQAGVREQSEMAQQHPFSVAAPQPVSVGSSVPIDRSSLQTGIKPVDPRDALTRQVANGAPPARLQPSAGSVPTPGTVEAVGVPRTAALTPAVSAIPESIRLEPPPAVPRLRGSGNRRPDEEDRRLGGVWIGSLEVRIVAPLPAPAHPVPATSPPRQPKARATEPLSRGFHSFGLVQG